MTDKPNCLSGYDIRSPDLDEKDTYKLTSAISQIIDKNTVIVGKDQREGSAEIFDAGRQGFHDNGVQTISPPAQYGVGSFATTDMIAYLAKDRDVYGLMFSPSHMPEGWRGIKPLTPQGRIFNNAEMEDIAIAYENQPGPDVIRTSDYTVDDTAYTDYLEGLKRSYHDEFSQDLSGQTIVVDPGNAAGVLGLPDALDGLGATVKLINENTHIEPQRSLEPKEGELGQLERAVLDYEADLGLATDGDADRVVAVNNKGNVMPGSQYLALVGQNYVRNGEESIACSVNTSSYVSDVIEEASGSVHWTPLGAVFTALTTLDNDISFGGQPNGHMMKTPFVAYDSAAVGGTDLAGILAGNNQSLAEHQRELPDYHVRKMNIDVPETYKEDVIRVTHNRLQQTNDEILSTKDGIKSRRGNSEYLVRGSGSEPLIRVYAGSSAAGKEHALANSIKNTVETAKKLVTKQYDI